MADETDPTAEIDAAAIQAELDRMKHQVTVKTAAVAQSNAAMEQMAAANAAMAASVKADVESIEAIEGLTGGEPGEPLPPDGPDLARGRLYHSDVPITAPIDLAPGQLIGLKAVAMVVKVNVTTGRHRKLAGAASSKSPGQGAFGIGINPKGALDIWRNGGAFNQIAGPPALLARKASMLEWVAESPAPVVRFSADEEQSQLVEVDGKTVRSDIVLPLVPVDGAAAVGAGYWSGQRVDPLGPDGVILAIGMWDRDLSAEEWLLWEQQHDHLVDDVPDPPVEPPIEPPVEPPITPPGDGLEPVNSGALRSDIVVNDEKRQTVIGYGWGAGGHEGEINELAKRFEQKLFDGLNCKIIRLHNSQSKTFVGAYKGVAQIARKHGCHVLCTGYMYRAKSNPKALADSVRAAIDAGIEITHLAIQNEPDGHPDNKEGNYVDHYRELIGRLPSSVKIIGMEWRHPEKGNEEFDRLASAGLIGNGNIAAGGLHIYNKAALPALYDQRWLKRGMALWSTETGDMSAPKAAAQFIAGLLHGSAVEIAHLGIGSGSDQRQVLMNANGTVHPWGQQTGLIARALPSETVMRGVTSSDRPGGMGADQARLMLWTSTPRQPRHFVAVGKRPDNKWVLAAVSFAFGGDSPSEWAGGHYGGATQQLTVRIAELAGKNGSFVARRCSSGGALSGEQGYELVDGHIRFTLPPGEAITVVGG